MAALTAPRIARRLNSDAIVDTLSMKVKASTIIYAGALVCTDATGYAVPGSTSTTQKCWGIAEETADNSTGANGDIYVKVRRGAFNLNVGTAGDALAQADIGAMVFVIDDNTVGKTNGGSTRSVAGKFLGYETDGVPYFEITGQVAA
jgi:hypothetical protein